MLYNRAVQYLQHHGKQENYLQFKDETWLILCCKTRFAINTLYSYITAAAEQLSYTSTNCIEHGIVVSLRMGKEYMTPYLVPQILV